MRKKDDEKQKNIKKAVVKLILEEGFHGTSMAKIAKAAGVSPATVYIYYENKESMLQDIYREYSEEFFHYLLSKIQMDMTGRQLIKVLIHSYYTYIKEHEEAFHFIEQFSSCPALANQCDNIKGIYSLYKIFDDMKEKKIMKGYCNDNLSAIIFSPIKSICTNHCNTEETIIETLEEMIKIIQEAILI